MSTSPKQANGSGYKATENDEEYYYEEEEWSFSSTTKYILIATGIILSGAIIYLFCFILPNMFIPQLVDLVGINKVQELPAELAPVSPEVVQSWRTDAWDIVEHEDEDEDEDEEQEDEEYVEDAQLEESKSDKTLRQRFILIGDIHGQYIQLRKLLRKIGYNKKKDTILALGDFIAKGPDSIKVLEFLIDNNAECILGNHEYYVLQNYALFHGLESPYFVGSNLTALKNPDMSSKWSNTRQQMSIKGFNDDPEYLLAKKLQPHHIKYINLCGMIKKLGKVPFHSAKTDGRSKSAQGLAVHAGLRWDLTSDLNDQDPSDCLEMRAYLKPFYNETTDDPHANGAVSWSKVWNLKNKDGDIDNHYVVYYGHDARHGLNLKKWTKGMDDGCVGGGKLAAMVLWQEETKKGVLYKEQVIRVTC